MKSEKKPFLFTLFLMVGETAKIFYRNGFWEPNEQSIAEMVEEGKDEGNFVIKIFNQSTLIFKEINKNRPIYMDTWVSIFIC